ncbi:MAG: type II toxin-antitoxin system PemK/MazF family toxin [Pseudomonadales bacterium]
MVARGEIWLVNLDPTIGSGIRKSRPCLVISPPELHDHLRTVMLAPMTTASRPAPFRVPISHDGKRGLVLIDQIRTVDKARLIRRLGSTSPRTLLQALRTLQEVFAK